jgi:putative aldouronate transport system substrate-binding protein
MGETGMNQFRKPVGILLTLALGASVGLTACSSNGDKDSGATSAATAATGTPAASAAGGDKTGWKDGKYDPPITLTTIKGVDPATKFKKGETIENNVHTKLVKEKLGIDIKYDWTVTNSNDAYKTKLRLMLSSGEKMPDVVTYRGDVETYNMLIESGQFMAVDELFDKYANETYKKGTQVDPTMWLPVTKGGKKMALPILDYGYNDDMVLWLREDWMQKLNLQAPKNLDDFEKIMDAFVNQDPDGNNKKDTIGLAAGMKNGYLNWMTDLTWVFGAYGTMPEVWLKQEDGNLVNGIIQPGAKQALAKLKDWMDKGYLHKDSALKDDTTGAEFFTKGQAGAIVGRNWLPDWPFPDLVTNVPGAKYKAYPIPAGPDGKIGAQSGNPPVNGYLFINKNAKNPEAVLHYYNFFFDEYANPKKGGLFENGFAEGYDWAKLPDGTVTKDVKAHPQLFPNNVEDVLVEPDRYTLTYEGARIPTLYADTMIKLANGSKPETPYEIATSKIRKQENLDAMKIVMDQKGIRMKNNYMGPLTQTMGSKNELLLKLYKETYSKIIYGQAPLDDFDKMVQNWKTSGGDTITKEVNDWYKAVNAK